MINLHMTQISTSKANSPCSSSNRDFISFAFSRSEHRFASTVFIDSLLQDSSLVQLSRSMSLWLIIPEAECNNEDNDEERQLQLLKVLQRIDADNFLVVLGDTGPFSWQGV
ncbi:unnamed protein product [Vicia faba]|uniref:Uncharacterized protein n=1 Tax=Vicia faba TaxID=3906 RepID=A0AAV0ZQD4_VICFA|nr:unnamed protein product [Vicia faba]